MSGGRGPALALLCDLDGTLIDSERSVLDAFRSWGRDRGLDPDAVLATFRHGVPSADLVADMAPHLDPAAEAAELDRRQAEDTRGVVGLAGARELLAGPWPAAVVTSCTLELARARLTAGGLAAPDVLVTPERISRGKPDPEGFLLAARELDVAPERCVVLEDAPAGVAAGRAAGMRVFAVLTTHTRAELPDATGYVDDLFEVPEMLRELE
ncbi:MAG TPA: HAD-IA family hydrolase [Solirubrobacteraceae bacterium]